MGLGQLKIISPKIVKYGKNNEMWCMQRMYVLDICDHNNAKVVDADSFVIYVDIDGLIDF